MARPLAITSLPPSPDEDRRKRVAQYLIAMGVRVGCLFAAFVTTGWLQLICVLGAVVLPSIAVVIANAKGPTGATDHERPGRASLPPGPSPWS